MTGNLVLYRNLVKLHGEVTIERGPRRAVAATLSVADERVLHSGVQTTDTDGQVFQLVMLDGVSHIHSY